MKENWIMKKISFKTYLIEENNKPYQIKKKGNEYVITYNLTVMFNGLRNFHIVARLIPYDFAKNFFYLKVDDVPDDMYVVEDKFFDSFMETLAKLNDVKAVKINSDSYENINMAMIYRIAHMDKKYYSIKNPKEIVISKDRKYIRNLIKRMEKKAYSFEDVERVGDLILNNCWHFLNEIDYQIDKYVLYRGINVNEKKLFLEGQVRLTDRKPLTIDKEVHDYLNVLFDKKFGHPYRNGLFVTGNKTMADHYAKTVSDKTISTRSVYAVFPIGKFEFVWSKKVRDLFINVDNIINLKKDVFEEKIKEIVNSYQINNLKEAIKSGHEIMIWCEKYYALLDGTEFQKEVFEYIKYNK